MILCTHCGNQNRNDNAFCTSCGNKLAEEPLIVGRLILLGDEGNREYLIGDSAWSIGRDGANDLVVDDDEISSRHARITFSDDSFWVEDLDSTNGTFVNGERISSLTRLHDDDLLKMGRVMMKFKA